MLAQGKTMKSTWPTNRDGGTGPARFQGAEKRPSEGEDLNAHVSNTLKEVIKINKRLKYKASSDYRSEYDQDYFNFDNLKIRKE